MQPKLSKGQDEAQVTTELNALINGGWSLNEEQTGVKKTYHFKTYMVGDSCSHYSRTDFSMTSITASG